MATNSEDTYPSYEEMTVGDDSVRDLLEDAKLCLESGDTESAIAAWHQVIAIDRDNEIAIASLNEQGIEPFPSGRAITVTPILSIAPEAPNAFEAENSRHSIQRKPQRMPVVTGSIDYDRVPSIIIDPERRNQKPIGLYLIALGLLAAAVVIVVMLLPKADKADKADKKAENAPATAATTATQPPPAPPAAVPAADPDEVEEGYFEVRLTTDPATAAVYIDGELVGTGKARVQMPKDGRTHRLSVRSPGYKNEDIVFVDVAPLDRVELTELDRQAVRSRRRARRTPRSDPASTKTKIEPPAVTAPLVVKPKPKPKKAEPTRPPSDNRDPWAN